MGASCRQDRTAPTPASEASTTTTNCFPASGRVRTGAEEKRLLRSRNAASALVVQTKVEVLEVRAVWGAATEL